MIDRQLVWSNPEVQAKLASFVLAADEVWSLQHRESPEARLFRQFAEEGHYGRRSQSLTRQGIYAVTPGGHFLGSWNTRYLPKVLEELDQALERWEQLDPQERLAGEALSVDWRWSDAYPEKGLALLVTTRDMPRDDLPETMRGEWRRTAWNQDRFWISEQELAGLRSDPKVQQSLAQRFVRVHGRDNARGQSPGYPRKAVQEARWTLVRIPADDDREVYRVQGYGAVEETGRWRINDRHDEPATHTRSFAGPMLGEIEFEGERCVRFELAWVGERQGATQYNGRADDPGPAPMGVVMTLAPAHDRVAPSMIGQYGWKRPSVEHAVPD